MAERLEHLEFLAAESQVVEFLAEGCLVELQVAAFLAVALLVEVFLVGDCQAVELLVVERSAEEFLGVVRRVVAHQVVESLAAVCPAELQGEESPVVAFLAAESPVGERLLGRPAN
ncbi:MAG: hypothetical protein ACKV0T_20175 [Planctomycetales bacterium]